MNNAAAWRTPGQFVMPGVGLLQGLSSGLNNLLLLSTILYQKELRCRKENVVIFSVAMADCLHGCGHVVHSLSLVHALLSHNSTQPVLRQECLLTGVPVFSIFTLTMQATMLVLQSADRLLAVSKPLYYFGTTVSLPWRMCLVGFMYSFLQTLLLVWLSWDTSDTTVSIGHQFCYPLTALKPGVFAYWNTNHMVLGTVSVVLFGVVLLLYRRHMNTVAPDTERQLQEHMAVQRRVTKSMALSCAATLALFVAPRIINLILISFMRSTARQIVFGIAYFTYNSNPILNFFIYMKRHENIRKGFILMFKCQQLSLNQRAYDQRVKRDSVSGNAKPEGSVFGRRSGLPSNTATATARGAQKVDAKHLLVRYSIRNAEEVCSIEDN